MKEFSKNELLNLKEGTKVLVHVMDEDWWLVCSIKSDCGDVMLKDISTNSYLVGINDDYETFCKVYKYTKDDVQKFVKTVEAEEKDENKELEVIEPWTMSVDWKKKCVNINLNSINKKIEMTEKDVLFLKDCFEALRLKDKGLF